MQIFISQHKEKLSLIFCIVLSIASITWQSRALHFSLSHFNFIGGRFITMIGKGVGFFDTSWQRLSETEKLQEKYQQALTKIEQLEQNQEQINYLLAENQRFRDLLDYPPSKGTPETIAQVLSIRLNTISPHLVVGKGKDAGIRAFMPVIGRGIDENGNNVSSIVGLVVDVHNHFSVVQPITHPNFQMGVRISGSGEWAILSGNSGYSDELLLEYVITQFISPAQVLITQEKEKNLNLNSQIVSSGNAGIYPPQLLVGFINRIGKLNSSFRTAYVKPYVRIAKLDQVSIILKPREAWSQVALDESDWSKNIKSEFGHVEYSKQTERFSPESEKKQKNTTKKNEEKVKPATEKSNLSQDNQSQNVEDPATNDRRILKNQSE